MFIALVENKSLSGVFNGVAPNPETNKKLTQLLAKQLGKPLILPNAPAFVIKLLFGEMGSMLLGSQHISAQKILDTGFTFQFPTAQKAMADLVQ
jgi:NAD dependent epimerase/dehydratase family enzyme